jgi:hypothetical protein
MPSKGNMNGKKRILSLTGKYASKMLYQQRSFVNEGIVSLKKSSTLDIAIISFT